MKIRKLILQNINSLYGKWEIDFDCEAFRRSGIFAVTGRTGSGKSTILDAMCIALYGKTPRLSKSTEKAVSRGCSESLCELTFLDAEGREWTATYAYETKSKGRNKGQMKDAAIHRLACNGKTVADKTTMVTKMVEEITGLDSTRFCRAVLLAQGSFDAFLNAGKDNSQILERITGTEIYSRISEKLKERYDAEKSKLDILQAACEGIALMTDEEAAEMRDTIAEAKKEIAVREREQTALNQTLRNFQERERLDAELAKCDEAEKNLAAEELDFAASRKRLEAGKKVFDAERKYRPFKEKNDQLAVVLTALEKSGQSLPDREKLCEETGKKQEAATGEAERYEQEFRAFGETLTSVRKFDDLIRTLETDLAEAGKIRRSEVLKALACRGDLHAARRALAQLKRDHGEATAYLEAHPRDGELVPVREVCGELLEKYRASSLELKENRLRSEALRKEAEKLQRGIDEKAGLLEAEKRKLDGFSAEEATIAKKNENLLDGTTRERWQELLESHRKCHELALTIRSLDEHRRQLADGQPCPLCGAKEHPYALGNVPEPEKEKEEYLAVKARLDAIADAEKELQAARTKRNECEKTCSQCQNALDQLKIQLDFKRKELDGLSQSAQKTQADLARTAEKIRANLEPFGLNWDERSDALPDALASRIRDFERHRAEQAVFEEKKEVLEDDVLRFRTALRSALGYCRDRRREWECEREKLAAKKDERTKLFGDRDPEQEARAAEKKRKDIASRLEAARRAFTAAETDLARTREEIDRRKRESAELQEIVAGARENFLFACREANVTEAEFHACVLDQEEMTKLSALDSALIERRKQLAREREECETAIRALDGILAAQKKSREDVSAELASIAEELGKKNQSVGVLLEKMKQDEAAKCRMAEQRELLLEQRKVTELWNRMYDLVGGDRFQRFAQEITLEHLLALANLELEKLSGRYRLLRSREEELGIDVADRDQCDEIRSSRTLSGGERFLVSLSLALGLSRMAGEKIRVDSLFLDEGFGTLDAETLETALEALGNLRSRGKLVGVISHVAALAEKIPCIIEVNKTGGGRSTLRGPGVRAL